MTVTAFIFLEIKLVEFLTFFFCGKKMEKTSTNKSFWKCAVWPILVYGLAEGLRWGHDVDYNVYAIRFRNINYWVTSAEHSNPLFSVIVYFLKLVGCPYTVFLILQCMFLIFSAALVVKYFKSYARWIFPCLLIAFLPNENFIRFYLSFSFLLVGIYFLFGQKIMLYAFFALLASLTHFAMAPMACFFIFMLLFKNVRINIKAVVVVFILSVFFGSIQDFGFLVTISNWIGKVFHSFDNQGMLYLNGMDRIIAGEAGGGMGISLAKTSNQLKRIAIYVPMLVLLYSHIKNIKWGQYAYNIVMINCITSPIMNQVELLGRFSNVLDFFSAIVMGVFAKEYLKKASESRYVIVVIISLFCFFYSLINSPFVREDDRMYYIWDSKGQYINWNAFRD